MPPESPVPIAAARPLIAAVLVTALCCAVAVVIAPWLERVAGVGPLFEAAPALALIGGAWAGPLAGVLAVLAGAGAGHWWLASSPAAAAAGLASLALLALLGGAARRWREDAPVQHYVLGVVACAAAAFAAPRAVAALGLDAGAGPLSAAAAAAAAATLLPPWRAAGGAINGRGAVIAVAAALLFAALHGAVVVPPSLGVGAVLMTVALLAMLAPALPPPLLAVLAATSAAQALLAICLGHWPPLTAAVAVAPLFAVLCFIGGLVIVLAGRLAALRAAAEAAERRAGGLEGRLEQQALAAVEVGDEGTVTFASAGAERVLPDAARARFVAWLSGEAVDRRPRELRARLDAGEACCVTVIDGGRRLRWTLQPRRAVDGGQRLYALCHDLSRDWREARAAGRRLRGFDQLGRQVSRRQVLRELSADIKAPLTQVMAFADVAQRLMPGPPAAGEEARRALDRVREQTRRTARTVQRHRRALPAAGQRRPVEVGAVLVDVVSLFTPEARRARAVVVFEPPLHTPWVEVVVAELQLLLLELLRSAVSAAEVAGARGLIGLRLEQGDSSCWVDIEDHRLPPDDPRSRELAELPLPMEWVLCRSLAERHGGELSVEPRRDGEPARTRLQLPLHRIVADEDEDDSEMAELFATIA